jgi:hypothetical protein
VKYRGYRGEVEGDKWQCGGDRWCGVADQGHLDGRMI